MLLFKSKLHYIKANKSNFQAEFLLKVIFIKEVRVRIRTAREQVQRKCRGEVISDNADMINNREDINRMMTASTPDILLLG